MLPENIRDVAWLRHEADHLDYLSKTYPDIKIDVVNTNTVYYYSRLIHSDPKVSFEYEDMDMIERYGCTISPRLQIDNCEICNSYYGTAESWIVSDLDIDIFRISDEDKLSLYAYREFMLDNGFLEPIIANIDLFVIKFIRDHGNLKELQIDNRFKKLLLFS